jgi:aryl-alcohol dehydrogenase-like predicted oxidoreductase
MELRQLGRSSIKVAPLALGGNVFGWTADAATSERLLDAFVAAGFNLIDTADIYSNWVQGNSGGESETIIGRWLSRSGKRDQVVQEKRHSPRWWSARHPPCCLPGWSYWDRWSRGPRCGRFP